MDTLAAYNRAEESYLSAKEEMNRPEEDIVPYLVCERCQLAISLYLQGYLHHAGINFSQEAELSELVDLVMLQDEKFKVINRSILQHLKDTGDFWMNIDRAREYIRLVEKTRFIVGL